MIFILNDFRVLFLSNTGSHMHKTYRSYIEFCFVVPPDQVVGLHLRLLACFSVCYVHAIRNHRGGHVTSSLLLLL